MSTVLNEYMMMMMMIIIGQNNGKVYVILVTCLLY